MRTEAFVVTQSSAHRSGKFRVFVSFRKSTLNYCVQTKYPSRMAHLLVIDEKHNYNLILRNVTNNTKNGKNTRAVKKVFLFFSFLNVKLVKLMTDTSLRWCNVLLYLFFHWWWLPSYILSHLRHRTKEKKTAISSSIITITLSKDNIELTEKRWLKRLAKDWYNIQK